METKQVANKQNRSTSLELLRIISILLIIAFHYTLHGGIIFQEVNFNSIFIQAISFGGLLGVNCFILITGYFMVDSQFKIRKLLKLIFEVLFYTIGIYLVLNIFNIREFSPRETLISFMPITYGMYWFVTTYVVLYILSPFINIFIKGMNKQTHKKIIYILIFLWCIIPTLFTRGWGLSHLGWFITLYLIAAYFKLYPSKFTLKSKTNIFISIITSICIMISIVGIFILKQTYPEFGRYVRHFTELNIITTLIASITLFLGFKNMKMKYSKFINSVALTTFGVYLIHENPFLMNYIWMDIFKTHIFFYTDLIVVQAIVAIFTVYIACVIIDYIRIIFVEKPLFKLIDKLQLIEKVQKLF